MISSFEKIVVDVGEHGEGMPWEIDPSHQTTVNVNSRVPEGVEPLPDEKIPCRHCVEVKRTEEYNRPNPNYRWTRVTYVFPAVVAYNESGYNATAVCLQCLLETLKANGLLGR